jgi:dTDP-4-dehydrorhamnose reductase
VLYSGVTTNYLARVVGDLLEHHRDLHGLYQVASEPISKFHLLQLVRDAFALPVDVVPSDDEVSDRTLIGGRFVDATGYVTPSWPQLIQELADDPTPYDAWK